MSHGKQSLDPEDVLSLESGLEALQTSPEFRGPVESLDGHESNDHLALIYEDQAEQFAAAIPFVRQGLERGERCMYIADENSEAEILAAMRARGIDADAALESGALTIHTKQDTYCRDGEFVPDEMIAFLDDAIQGALEEYEALRVTGETTWVLGDEPRVEDLVEYENKLNDLLPEKNSIALCQYNRERFPPEAIRDVIMTHPHLVYDSTICQNVYYTPPEELFGSERPAHDVDRMVGTLLDRTETKTELQARQRFLREQYQITADPDRTFEEKLQALFEMGCERFGLDLGGMARVDPDADLFEVEAVSGEHEHLVPGAQVNLSETYCRELADRETTNGASESVDVSDPVNAGFEDTLAYKEFGVETYLGTRIEVDGGLDRTLFFVSADSKERTFSEADRSFHRLMGQWVGYELARRRRERFLETSYEITSDPRLSFEEKIDRLLELGCEQFGLDVGCLTHLPAWDDEFRIETVVGPDGAPPEGVSPAQPEEGCYCRQAITEDEPQCVPDIHERGWEDDPVFRQHGIASYFGTKVSAGSRPYGTLWFGSMSPHEDEFTDTERTFLELMGQWVSYELECKEHKQYEQKLYETAADGSLSFEEKIDHLLDLGCERFDLDIGMLTHEQTESFKVERMRGSHPELDEGMLTPPMTDNYCRQLVSSDDHSLCISDAGEAGWDGDALYTKFGLECYVGVQVESEGEIYGTIFFTDLSPRDAGLTEAEQTFLELIGQFVSYELQREQRESQLTALNTLSRELMGTDSVSDMSEYVVEATEAELNLPITAIALYDEQEGVLRPAAETDAAGGRLQTASLLDVGDGIAWEAFIENMQYSETDPFGDSAEKIHPPVTEVLVAPLGNQGVFITGSTTTTGFSSSDVEFVETVAANITAAMDSVRREQQLHEREQTLESQNETLERLNRINDTIRNIDQVLVQASTRAEVEAAVCEQLADTGPYELAWIGEHDAIAQEVTPREWTGTEQGYLEEITVTTGDGPHAQGPAGSALRTREPQVVNDILTTEEFEPWRQDALNHGYHACVSLPLVYDDSLYGVLNVYAGQPGVFDELETTVLSELADNIAYAINAVESKKALLSDEIRELEFTVEDESLGPTMLTDEIDCELSLENVVHWTDGGLRAFVSVRKVSSAEVLAFMPQLPSADFELISEYDDGSEPVGLFEATVNDGSLAAMVQEHGGRLHAMHAVDGTTTVTVHLAADANVREFVEMLRRVYPDSELVAQRTRERVQQTSMEFSASVAEELTSRQMEVLQTAYYSGYFDQPRARTGSEIAASMDISQPTLNTHLRTAQRKLYRKLFEESLFV